MDAATCQVTQSSVIIDAYLSIALLHSEFRVPMSYLMSI